MSLARKHRAKFSAIMSAAASSSLVEGPDLPAAGGADPRSADPVAAQMRLRLTHDLRRLKEIQSIERKIEAKREMLPEYRAWIEGLLEAAKGGDIDHGEILPTVMVWLIDTGDYDAALVLARYVLRHGVAMPPRYDRAPATLIVEEIAEGALKLLLKDEPFDLDLLEQLDELTADEDMHDEVRAKLMKAIGLEYARQADAIEKDPAETPEKPQRLSFLRSAALGALVRGQDLNDRVGVKDRIKRLRKALEAAPIVDGASASGPAAATE